MKEFAKLAKSIKAMPVGKIEFILNSMYQQGYTDGHRDCCDELGLEDGDETCTISLESLKEQLNIGKTIDQIMEEINNGYAC